MFTTLTIVTYVWFNYLMIDEEVTTFIDYWLVRLGLRQHRRYYQGECLILYMTCPMLYDALFYCGMC